MAEACSCPKCGDPCDRESVDVGVGVIYGPFGCSNCGWSSDSAYDCSNGPPPIQQQEFPGWIVDQFGGAHSVVRILETTGDHMSIETGVLVDKDGKALHWHLPKNGNGGHIPDSSSLWEVIWKNREALLGIAHSHPGGGAQGPSGMDVTTFSAIEMALGRRLTWWIVTEDSCTAFRRLDDAFEYSALEDSAQPEWVEKLREESRYKTTEGGVS